MATCKNSAKQKTGSPGSTGHIFAGSRPGELFISGVLEMEATKRCSKCKQSKPISEFYKSRKEKDRLQTHCKSCQKRYRQSEQGKVAHRKANKKYNRSEKGKVANQVATNLFYVRHPNYRKAIRAVNHAIRTGRLPRPDTLLCHYHLQNPDCEYQAKQYHHWHGYEKEHLLDVVPACVNCHRKEHRKVA